MDDEFAPVSLQDFLNEPDTDKKYLGQLSGRVSKDTSTGLGFDLKTKMGSYVYETQDVKNNAELGDLVAHLVGKTWMTPGMLWDIVCLGRYRNGGE